MGTASPKARSLIAFLILAAMFPLFAVLERIIPPQWASLRGSPLLLDW